MKITLSGGNGSSSGRVPRDGNWIVRNPTANTFQMSTSATGEAETLQQMDLEMRKLFMQMQIQRIMFLLNITQKERN